MQKLVALFCLESTTCDFCVNNLTPRRLFEKKIHTSFQTLRVETANPFYFSAYIVRLRYKVVDFVSKKHTSAQLNARSLFILSTPDLIYSLSIQPAKNSTVWPHSFYDRGSST